MRHAAKALVLGLAALLAASGAVAQVDFTKYVAVGDSLTAGYASGGLATMYQQCSYPKQIAGQGGVTSFQQPTISNPGIPAVLELQRLMVLNGTVVPVIAQKAGQGSPTNATLAGPYNNLGIPGSKVSDLLTRTGNIQAINPANIMYDLVLRDGQNPAINQAVGAQGTVYTIWAGNNDVLNAALSGVALDGVTLTPVAAFQQAYQTLVGGIHQQRPNADIVVATIPNVTDIPFVTTVKPYVFAPNGTKVYLIGEAGQLTDGDYLTLGASALLQQGFGLSPAKPLPEGSVDATGLHAGVILRAAEISAIRTRTQELNTVIRTVAGAVGAPVFDANAFFADVVTHGIMVGGVRLSAAFLTGGLFSYDGVHPQCIGYAIIANEFIRVMNEELGADLEYVNLRSLLLGTANATSVTAADAVFSTGAMKALLAIYMPEALTDQLEPQRSIRRRVR